MKVDYLNFLELYHHGIKGQKWGIRRFQNEDGTLTEEGIKRYKKEIDKMSDKEKVKNYLNDSAYVKYGPNKVKPTSKLAKDTLEKFDKDITDKSKEAVDEYFKMTGFNRKKWEEKSGPIDYKEFADWIFEDDGYSDLLDTQKDMSKIKKIRDDYYKIIDNKIKFESQYKTQNILDKYYGKEIIEKANIAQKKREKTANFISAFAATTASGLILYIASKSGNKK